VTAATARLASDTDLDEFVCFAVASSEYLYFITTDKIFFVDYRGRIGTPCADSGGDWDRTGHFRYLAAGGGYIYVASDSGIIQMYEGDEFSTIFDFGKYEGARVESISGFGVAEEGTCFVSGLKPRKLLVCSLDDEVASELDCHEELDLLGVESHAVVVGKSESGDFIKLDFSETPPKRTELIVGESFSAAACAPDGSCFLASGSCLYVMRYGDPKLIYDMTSSLQYGGDVSIVSMTFRDEKLFVATRCASGHRCTSVWTISGLPSSSWEKHQSLITGMDVDPDFSISINGYELKLHILVVSVMVMRKVLARRPASHLTRDTSDC
jgi:hypothetical protein